MNDLPQASRYKEREENGKLFLYNQDQTFVERKKAAYLEYAQKIPAAFIERMYKRDSVRADAIKERESDLFQRCEDVCRTAFFLREYCIVRVDGMAPDEVDPLNKVVTGKLAYTRGWQL